MDAVSGVIRVALVLLFAAVSGADAASARKRVEEGNRAFAAGQFADALAAYDEAGVEAPESAEIVFNRALAFYRQGEYAKAVDAFGQASLKTKDARLESRSKFGLGNCAFREAERQRDSDLQKALESFQQSVRHYQDALALDPEFKPAAENIEVARLIMKSILDEIKKREEEARKQQEAQQQAADKLKELLKRQEEALQKNKSLSDQREKAAPADLPDGKDKVRELGTEQRKLADDTLQAADGIQQAVQQQQQPPSAQGAPPPADVVVRQHLDQAVAAQNEAADRLDEDQGRKAEPCQTTAIEALKKALESLTQEQTGQQQQKQQQNQQDQQNQQGKQEKQDQQGKQDQQEKQGQQEKQDQQGEPEKKDQKDPKGDQEKKEQQDSEQEAAGQDQAGDENKEAMENVVPLPDEARDILDEEEENRELRKVPNTGYRAVDRDW